MLNIFTSKDYFKESEFVNDNESYFVSHGGKNIEAMIGIIEAIEGGKFLDESRFYDRFGVAVYNSAMSTGAKTLVNIASSDKIINGNEMGRNAREYMLWCIDGNVYLEPSDMDIFSENIDVSRITVNGCKVKSIQELEVLL